MPSATSPQETAVKIALVAFCAVLAGCASPHPVGINYGHPALNNIQAAPPYAAAGYPAQPMYQPYDPGYAVPAYTPAPTMYTDPGRVAAGAVIGGLIGSQFGGSANARIASSAAGAAIGVMAAQGRPSGQAIAGGIVGGVIGSRFGGGTGRNAAAAIGAGLGSWLAVP